MPKPHFSNSQLESYTRCPAAYYRRYIEREIIPPGVALLAGRGVHAGAKVNFEQKRETRQDLPAREIRDAAVAAFEGDCRGGYSLTDEETARGTKTVLGETVDRVADFAFAHATTQAPDYQPVLIEQPVTIALPASPMDLFGFIDLADERRRIVDFKTGRKRHSQHEADTSTQLTIYSAFHLAHTGKPAAGVRLDTLVDQKRGIVRDAIDSTRGPADFAALASRINAVLDGIAKGSFPPATPGAWWCGPKWCGYWSTCPYVNSERAALVQLET